jgi:hypothetical protein
MGRSRTDDLCIGVISMLAALAPANAWAGISISSGQTQNVMCSNGVCMPTALNAVLNSGDLETMLASGNVAVTTTGSGGVQAKDIRVSTPFSWNTGSVLTLDAWRSLTIDRPISIQGEGGTALTTNDGGKNGLLSFGKKGNVTFANLSSSLLIDGSPYTLVDTIALLANDIAANPGGNYAFADNYDASADGTYASDPVSTSFAGTLQGLGNTISNLSVNTPANNSDVGMFYELTGTIANLNLSKVMIVGNANSDEVGGLVSANYGLLVGDSVSGRVKSKAKEDQFGATGGLAGVNLGVIMNCHSSATASGNADAWVGGLVGFNDVARIESSYATGNSRTGLDGQVGGLVGNNGFGSITDSYAEGQVRGGKDADAGGLLGYNSSGTVSTSYSTGAVGGDSGAIVGGLIGFDDSTPGSLTAAYWDTTTSGITDLSQGAGNLSNDPGITGLTTAQFQQGLPDGFDRKVWREKASINVGLPYLFANPQD